MIGAIFEATVNIRIINVIPAILNEPSTQEIEYSAYSGLISWIGINGVSSGGTTIRYLFTQSAITTNNDTSVTLFMDRNHGNPNTIIGTTKANTIWKIDNHAKWLKSNN